ncbi:MAG TPA: hypothetical protein VIN33_06650, partial [Marinobacter sp.]
MKWLAFGLLLINGALWFYGDSFVPKRAVVVAERQTLPRVADLRAVSTANQERPVSSDPALGQVETVVEPREPVPQRYCVRLGW